MNPLQLDATFCQRRPPFIVALDFADAAAALSLVNLLDPASWRLKIGSELFTATGSDFVAQLIRRGFDVFLDLKFHDIPHTVAKACAAAAALGVWMLDVHTLGGEKMLEAAANAVANYRTRPLLIGVTVLTSMTEDDIAPLGFNRNIADLTLNLARTARRSGLDGVVASGREVALLKQHLGQDLLTVTPGIRGVQDAAADQKRIMQPLEALQAGSDYLVLGRAVTRAPDPEAVLAQLIAVWEQFNCKKTG